VEAVLRVEDFRFDRSADDEFVAGRVASLIPNILSPLDVISPLML
jgi:hypothetical protein